MGAVVADDGVCLAGARVAVCEHVAGATTEDEGEGWGDDGLEDGDVVVGGVEDLVEDSRARPLFVALAIHCDGMECRLSACGVLDLAVGLFIFCYRSPADEGTE